MRKVQAMENAVGQVRLADSLPDSETRAVAA
jgi:hypothetical protein